MNGTQNNPPNITQNAANGLLQITVMWQQSVDQLALVTNQAQQLMAEYQKVKKELDTLKKENEAAKVKPQAEAEAVEAPSKVQ